MLGALDEIGADEVIISGEQRLLAPKAGTTSIIIATRNKLAIISRTIPHFFVAENLEFDLLAEKKDWQEILCSTHCVVYTQCT